MRHQNRRLAFLAPVVGLLLLVSFVPMGAGTLALAAPSPVDALIEIVWPHDSQGHYTSVATARLVNVEVYLFQRGTLNPVSCNFDSTVRLRWAQNGTSHAGLAGAMSPRGIGWLTPISEASVTSPTGASSSEAIGQKIVRTLPNGISFPVWVFNDVSVEPYFEMGGTTTTYFVAAVDGVDYRTNVWAHGIDTRTLVTGPAPPIALSSAVPRSVDALIAIVWPHDAANRPEPVASAPLVNVGVDLAQHPSDLGHGRWTSVGFNFPPTVRLNRALNNGYLDLLPTAPRVITETVSSASATASPPLNPYRTSGAATTTTIAWPRYEFDDVDVVAAQNPANTYYFAASVDGVPTDTTIRAHGVNPRTHSPERDTPASSGAGC